MDKVITFPFEGKMVSFVYTVNFQADSYDKTSRLCISPAGIIVEHLPGVPMIVVCTSLDLTQDMAIAAYAELKREQAMQRLSLISRNWTDFPPSLESPIIRLLRLFVSFKNAGILFLPGELLGLISYTGYTLIQLEAELKLWPKEIDREPLLELLNLLKDYDQLCQDASGGE